MIGLPNSSFEKDLRSLQWAVRNMDKATFWISIPYYNTALYDWVRQNARLLRKPVGDNLVNTLSTMPFFDTREYPEEEIKRMHTIASLRTGVHYFYEYFDGESQTDSPSDVTNRLLEHRRKFIQTILRYDPPFLSRVIHIQPSLEFPFSPISAETSKDKIDEPLPGDLLGSFGSFE